MSVTWIIICWVLAFIFHCTGQAWARSEHQIDRIAAVYLDLAALVLAALGGYLL